MASFHKKDVAEPTCIVVKTPAQVAELEAEWNELWLKAKGSFYQSYSVAHHSWNEIACPAGRSLFCIFIREQGKLTLVFPLVRYHKGPLRMLRPLGPNAAEATDVLVDPDSDYYGNVALAWRTIENASNADIIHMPFVKTGSPLDQVIRSGRNVDSEPDVAPFADLQYPTEWEDYAKEVFSANSRQQLKRKQKKLSERGDFEFVEINPVSDPNYAVELMDWMFTHKKVWAEKVDKHGDWLTSPAYQKFVSRWITDPNNVQPMRIYAILIDKMPVAIKLFSYGISHLDLIIAAFHSHPHFAKYSPGFVLDQFWMKLIFEKHLNVDFGVGSERYKLFWSRNRKSDVASYHIPQTLMGHIATRLWRIKRRTSSYVAKFRSRKAEAADTPPPASS